MRAPQIDVEKRALRRRMRTLRDALEDRECRARNALSRAERLLRPYEIVAGYVGIGSELDPMPLLERLARGGATVALPVAAPDAPLTFLIWRPGDALAPGRFRVPEPVAGDAVTPDVLLVPLLAFTSDGARLGQGGGHYDRTLAALPRARALGLAFEAQRTDTLPIGPLDRPLERTATEDAVYGRAGLVP